MIDSIDILTLLSIPSEEVLTYSVVKDTNDISYIDIELKDNRPYCPFCFCDKIVIKDYYKVKINNSIIRQKKLFINVNVRRYKCKNCNKTFKQNFSLYKDNSNISNEVKTVIQRMLMDQVSMEYIAKSVNVNKKTVINVLDDLPDPKRLLLGKVICLDEFHFSNANNEAGKYPCVISNPFNSEIIDIIESRRQPYLIEYFAKIPENELKSVKYYITDMNETYRKIHDMFFKDSIYIVDHFHIVKLFTDAIQSIRIKIMKEQDKNTKAYKYLKKNWKLFLKNRWDLKDSTYINKRTGVIYHTLDSIDMVLKTYPELHYVYWCKHEFCEIMLKLHEYEETKKYIDFFIKKYCNSPIKVLNRIGRTFKRWYNEIINAYAKNLFGIVLTNAMAESNNNYIQTLINISYGYSNFKRLRKRILYMSSYKNSILKKQSVLSDCY